MTAIIFLSTLSICLVILIFALCLLIIKIQDKITFNRELKISIQKDLIENREKGLMIHEKRITELENILKPKQ